MGASWEPGWQEDSHRGPPCPGCWEDIWSTHGTTRPRARVLYYNKEIFSGSLEVLKKWNSSWEQIWEDAEGKTWLQRGVGGLFATWIHSWWWWLEVGWRADLLVAWCQDADIKLGWGQGPYGLPGPTVAMVRVDIRCFWCCRGLCWFRWPGPPLSGV